MTMPMLGHGVVGGVIYILAQPSRTNLRFPGQDLRLLNMYIIEMTIATL